MTIKEVKPIIWNFKIIGGEAAWQEVAYSAKMSGVPASVGGEEIFKMILANDYGSALEHVIVKFDIKMSKGNAPELLEHRLASHSGYSTRYITVNKGMDKENEAYEIITPWHLVKDADEKIRERALFLGAVTQSIEAYEKMMEGGVPREIARYALPFCQAVGIYHFTMNLRSLINFLGLRLCVRASAEMRCLAAQLYFLALAQLPILNGMLGCRGFMFGLCPESNVTGVRTGNPLPNYPVCPFKAEQSKSRIPTRREFREGLWAQAFDLQQAVAVQEENFRLWARWGR
jgi:flavin-dependent thymidylate synthase